MRIQLAFLRLLAFLAVVFQVTNSAAATVTLNPTADAYVRGGTWADGNFGAAGLFTQTSNNSNQNYDSYLKFDTTSVGSVANAKFRIAASYSGGKVGMTIYAVADTTWSESAITWNNKPARGSVLGTVTVAGSTYVYYEFDVSGYVIAEKAAGRNVVSFALHNPANSSQQVWMRSRDTASSTPPELVLTQNQTPTVALTSPANGATFTAPASITLTATAADSDGTIQKVEFFHGGTNLIATVTSAPYTFNWTNVAPGSYTLTAKATDNVGGVTTSAPVNITVNTGVAQLHFIHADHLNTPRLITNNAGQAVWRWDQSDPFGGNVPNENPSGLGTFTCNLRLPGQYFDKETNLHYNYFRDYDAGIGRYVQSDPIGLAGGINTYAYVGSNPLSRTDPTGEVAQILLLCLGAAGAFYTSVHIADFYVQSQITNLVVQRQNQNLGQCLSPNPQVSANACGAAQSGQQLPIQSGLSTVRSGSQIPGTATGTPRLPGVQGGVPSAPTTPLPGPGRTP